MNKYVKIAMFIVAIIVVMGFGIQIGKELRLLF